MRSGMSNRAIAVPIVLAGLTAAATAGEDPCEGIAFEPPQSVELQGFNPSGIAAGDFDGDGDEDLAIGGVADSIAILTNDGTGLFTFSRGIEVGSHAWELKALDLDGDGNDDLIGAGNAGVMVLLNNGAGSLDAPAFYPAQRGFGGFDVGDLNGDGLPDIVAARESSDGISVFLGAPGGTLHAERFTPDPYHPSDVAIADFNGDAIPDAVITMDQDDQVVVFLGIGDGTFLPGDTLPVGRFPISLAAGDFDGDGAADFVVRSRFEETLPIFYGIGDGTFELVELASASVQALVDSDSIAAGDIDGDGHTDFIVGAGNGTQGETGATVLLGLGDRRFLPRIDYGGTTPVIAGLTLADFNNDGLLDIGASSPFLPPTARIIINQCDDLCSGADLARPYGDQDLGDINTFVAYFTTSNPIADLNRDESLDLADIVSFVGQFNDDCPGSGD
jgi:hypothetical protein